MRIAIVGSRNINNISLDFLLKNDTTEIVSGGARGVDTCARLFAKKHGIKLTEFLPDYKRYGKAAPLKRNITIIEYADEVVTFWDGSSRGTKFVIDKCKEINKPITVIKF